MAFIEVRLNKCTVYLTEDEIGDMLKDNIPLFKQAVMRGKAFKRSESLKQRIEEKKKPF